METREAHIDTVRLEQKFEDGTEQGMWILGEENQYKRVANEEPQDMKPELDSRYYASNISSQHFLIGLL